MQGVPARGIPTLIDPARARTPIAYPRFELAPPFWPEPPPPPTTSPAKNLLMPLFLMGGFPVDFQEAKRLRMKSVKRPIKVGKRPINEGKRLIKAMVLVGISVGCLIGCFRAPQPCWKTAPLQRPIKRSMILHLFGNGKGATDLGSRWSRLVAE